MQGARGDHFSGIAAQYAQARPHYPAALFDWLAAHCAKRTLAWDCGAGNGQASVALAASFEQVHATDISAAQLAEAPAHPRIHYCVAPADASALPSHTADLITVAQALHWFDLDAFYAEARRVLRPGGLIAAWTYGVLQIEGDAVNAAVEHFYTDVIGPYWPPERHHVETGYRELAFPFTRIAAPAFAMEVSWTLAALLGYLRSWSASARYQAATGQDAVVHLGDQLKPLWGAPEQTRQIRWPLSVLAGR